jgi:hypothetical protein
VLRVERTAEPVRGEDVEPVVADECRNGAHNVEHVLNARADPLLADSAPARAGRMRSSGEVEEMRALHVGELQCTRERFEDGLGDPGEVAALEARVVGDAHTGEERHLLAA